MGKHHDHECNCDHDHNHDHKQGSGLGFALGVAIGAAVATLMSPDGGQATRKKAKAKLDELTGGKAPEEMIESLKELVGKVIGDIQSATDEGKAEAKRTERAVLKGKRPRKRK